MSPEQARGKAVDRRTDVWALGAVLWEMLTGRQLFGGETISDIVAAVLTREPDWAALPAGTPAAVRRLLAPLSRAQRPEAAPGHRRGPARAGGSGRRGAGRRRGP